MDTIGIIDLPTGVVAWGWTFILGLATLWAITLTVILVHLMRNNKPGTNRQDKVGSTVLIFVFVGLIMVIFSMIVFEADEDRYAAATADKIGSDLNLTVLSYEPSGHEVAAFTALDEDGDPIIGRTLYEKGKVYILSVQGE